MLRIESLLSARKFLSPQLVGDRVYFISDLSGHLSLYAMSARAGGSVPQPLLPPHIAMQNPELLDGAAFHVFPKLGKILVILDDNGDENYQPMLIPIEGGFPEPAFGSQLAGYRVHAGYCDIGRNIVYFVGEARKEAMQASFRGNLKPGQVQKLGEGKWGRNVTGVNAAHTKAILAEGYTLGDHVLFLWAKGVSQPRLLLGTPLTDRQEGQTVPLNAIHSCHFTPRDRGLLFVTALFSDTYGLGYFPLKNPRAVAPVAVSGAVHTGAGEMEALEHLNDSRYRVSYNIDGCSWMYEGEFDETNLRFKLDAVICGQGELANGKMEACAYEKATGCYAVSFSTATAPTQLFIVSGKKRKSVQTVASERVLGLQTEWLAPGEDASFTSFDGLRISARLYLPAKASGFEGPRPLVYYLHGGPQSQERPDFAWFSMPLIQFLTLNGFAVFVPNVRGSTGYGITYSKYVDRDWGGNDRLDHVHAMTHVLPKDKRLDIGRAGVVGRSYGGYMTLTLAARHPELWSAAVDMFGPYDLLTFADRVPEPWKPYISVAIGDPVNDRDALVERSPRTHMDQLACPLLVIQGKNDPRVVEQESRDLVERLRANGKQVEYLMFENEGHDVLKYENRVRCYNAITDFFIQHLRV
ncbi:MAG: S9 family peptidase [Chloroflexi bacterium]|nr:S9 family peptidase [Chloroflexota bacterium]